MHPELLKASKYVKAQALLASIQIAGSQAALARKLGLNRRTVTDWLREGAISPPAAYVLACMPGWPLTLEDMRPDILEWDKYEQLRTERVKSDCLPPSMTQGQVDILRQALSRARKAKRALKKQSTSKRYDDLL